ncbi:metalloregulator ArsR/SmtB family transcription factor [soil metagenome]
MKMNAALAALGALAQESRLQAFRMLVKEGPVGMPAGEISERLKVPPATLSFHLKELALAGLVRSERHGRSIRYAADMGGFDALVTYLREDCCRGRPELCCPAPSKPKRRRLQSATE